MSLNPDSIGILFMMCFRRVIVAGTRCFFCSLSGPVVDGG